MPVKKRLRKKLFKKLQVKVWASIPVPVEFLTSNISFQRKIRKERKLIINALNK